MIVLRLNREATRATSLLTKPPGAQERLNSSLRLVIIISLRNYYIFDEVSKRVAFISTNYTSNQKDPTYAGPLKIYERRWYINEKERLNEFTSLCISIAGMHAGVVESQVGSPLSPQWCKLGLALMPRRGCEAGNWGLPVG